MYKFMVCFTRACNDDCTSAFYDEKDFVNQRYHYLEADTKLDAAVLFLEEQFSAFMESQSYKYEKNLFFCDTFKFFIYDITHSGCMYKKRWTNKDIYDVFNNIRDEYISFELQNGSKLYINHSDTSLLCNNEDEYINSSWKKYNYDFFQNFLSSDELHYLYIYFNLSNVNVYTLI